MAENSPGIAECQSVLSGRFRAFAPTDPASPVHRPATSGPMATAVAHAQPESDIGHSPNVVDPGKRPVNGEGRMPTAVPTGPVMTGVPDASVVRDSEFLAGESCNHAAVQSISWRWPQGIGIVGYVD